MEKGVPEKHGLEGMPRGRGVAERSVFRGMSPDGIRKMAFELYSHRTELEAQNEELSRLRKELENLRVKYASVYDSAPVGYFTFDRDGMVLEVNRTAALQMNVEIDVLAKEPFFQYVARNSLEVFTLHCGKVFESGKPEAFETRLVRKDGSEFLARIECIPVPDSTGIITKCRAAVIDITGCGHSKEAKTEHDTSRVFFDEADDAFFLHDANTGNILDVNRKALELFGYSLEEAMSLTFAALSTGEAPYTEEDALGLIRKAAGGESIAFEWMVRDRGGRKFWAEVNLKRLIVQKKDCVLVVMRDITGRRKAEEALMVKDAAISSSINGMAMSDLEGNLTYVNRSFLGMSGHADEREVLGKHITEFSHDREAALEIMKAVRETGSWLGETVGKRKDGSLVALQLSASVVRNSAGDPFCMMASFVDISERKRIEEELRKHREHLERTVKERTAELRRANRELERVIAGYIQSEDSLRKSDDKYRKLVEAASDAIFVTDVESGVILDVNRRAVELSGVPREELVGMHQSMLYPEEGRVYYTESLSKAAAEGGATSLELIFRSRSGRMVPVEANASVVEIEGRKVLQGIFRDVSERRRLDGDLPGDGELKSAGIPERGVAHDFNNALTAVLNNIFLAKSLLTPDTSAYERLKAAERASLKARQLVQQVLAFPQGGAQSRKKASLQGMLEETVELALCGTNAVCDYSIPEDLWPVAMDEAQISQVISNLVTDADEAMPGEGAIRVSAENTVLKEGEVPPLMEGRYVRVDVGAQGMDGQNRDRLSDPCRTAREKGSGPYLAGIYAIVENHGGHISVEAGQEGGCVFHVFLPAVPEGAFVDDNKSAPQGTEGGSLESS